jgi:hypothetical protein
VRRIGIVALVSTLWVSSAAVLVAVADESQDLEDYLEHAAEADYAGREIVVTYDPEDTTAGMYDVRQSDGRTMVDSGDDTVMMDTGSVSSTSSDGYGGIRVTEWASWRLHARYELGPVTTGTKLGRAVDVVPIVESDRVRMQLVVDRETGAALQSEVFDGDGDLYRMAVMLDFVPGRAAPGAPNEEAGAGTAPSETVVPSTAPDRLPDELGAYWRADSYEGPDDQVHAFYTDGLFSFSVFELDGQADAGAFADADKAKIGEHRYRRLVDPGAVRVFWRSPDRTYVLVGDLPPDHLEDVLAELPEPGRRGVVVRLWRRLFG